MEDNKIDDQYYLYPRFCGYSIKIGNGRGSVEICVIRVKTIVSTLNWLSQYPEFRAMLAFYYTQSNAWKMRSKVQAPSTFLSHTRVQGVVPAMTGIGMVWLVVELG